MPFETERNLGWPTAFVTTIGRYQIGRVLHFVSELRGVS
jgi:hypothetical protein